MVDDGRGNTRPFVYTADRDIAIRLADTREPWVTASVIDKDDVTIFTRDAAESMDKREQPTWLQPRRKEAMGSQSASSSWCRRCGSYHDWRSPCTA